jgi:low temperature requirement protein LtrA
MGFAYYADLFDVDGPAYRVTLLGAMLLSMAVAVTLPEALQGGAAAFAGAYAALRAVLVGLYLWARRAAPPARRLAARYAGAFALGVLLWLASLLVPAPVRYALWVASLLVELTAPYLIQRDFLREGPVHTSHFPERLGLFTMLVLGESVVVTGTAVSGTAWDAGAALTAALGFVAVACLWRLYFDRVDEAAVERAYSRGGRELRRGFAWAYGHLFVYAGLAAMAVGNAMAIAAAVGPGTGGGAGAGAAVGAALGAGLPEARRDHRPLLGYTALADAVGRSDATIPADRAD